MEERNYNIFIIDSDLNHANLIKDHLKNHTHYTFHLFSAPEECLSRLSLKPALIFLDYELNPSGGMKSIEVLKKLKTAIPSAEVVLFTGKESVEVIKDSMIHGAYDYYIKDNNAHIKAEYLIVRILHHHQMKEEVFSSRKKTKMLFIFLGIMTLVAILMYYLGHITDNVGGAMF